MCTSCHCVRSSRKRMLKFVEMDYNFANGMVRKVFSKKYRRKCSDGSEFICDTCYSYLSNEYPKLPQKCA